MEVSMCAARVRIAVSVRAIALLALHALACSASAQSIVVSEPEITEAGNERFEFLVDIQGGEGTFDTFELVIESDGLFHQVGPPAELVHEFLPSEDSGVSHRLGACIGFGCGPMLSIFGVDASTDTDSLVSVTAASLGSNSASTFQFLGREPYLAAQIVMAPGGGGVYSYSFYDDGQPVGPIGELVPFGVPEPSSCVLFAVGGLAISSRPFMRRVIVLRTPLITKAAAVVLVLASHASAQSIVVSEPEITEAGNERFIFSLDVTGAEGTFDTFELKIESNGLFNQVGELLRVGSIRPSEDSGFYDLLDCPNCFGGQGLSSFGVDASTDTASLVQGTWASIADNSASSLGDYMIAQIVMAPGGRGSYSYGFWDNGNFINSSGGALPFGVPEPASLGLMVLATIAALARRSR